MQNFSAYGVNLVSLSVDSDDSGNVTITSTWDNAVKVVQEDWYLDVSFRDVSDSTEVGSVCLHPATAIVNDADLQSHAFVASRAKRND